ncbi:MAG TPA: cell division protein FtsZ, partial [Arcobacter sp.]|nr:cell division protein FtsZ [Arcobacter sp.]
MNEFNITESSSGAVVNGAKIKAIGVGGGGGNMINHMINEGVGGIDLLVANTDAQALDASLAPYKMQLGMNVTKGLGAGMKP